MLIGYVRVSTVEQNVNPQIDELKKAGCKKIFRDKVSGAKSERPGLQKALTYLREGDSLVVALYGFQGDEKLAKKPK